jgi:Trk-type K+ transport system membrane component
MRRPSVWFAVALPLLALVGTVALQRPDCTRPESADLPRFQWTHYWQSAFDAVSAACGAGLLTYDFEQDYTPQGRWTLTAIGVAGALLYVAAAARTMRGFFTFTTVRALPSTPVLIAAVIVLGAGCVPLLWFLKLTQPPGGDLAETTWQALSAFFSLGWTLKPEAQLAAWPIALIAWIGAAGWTLALLLSRKLRGDLFRTRVLLRAALGYFILLAIAATVIAALEIPRGARHALAGDAALADQSAGTRLGRGLIQTVAAAGAGIPTEPIADRAVSDGTKAVLAGTMLIGGMGGSAGGGVKWTLLIAAVFGAGVYGRSRVVFAGPIVRAGMTCVLALIALVIVVALGLLVIEAKVATSFQTAPTFADALLDAASAVAGGNLSSGLTAALTSRNLDVGIRLGAQQYQYGMAWIMLAMLVGRVLPLWVLCREAARVQEQLPPTELPLL